MSLILGRPCLVPDVPGCREVIGYGDYGILSDRTEYDFFKNILYCINNPEKLNYYSKKSIERSKFSDKSAMKNTLRFLLNNRK